MIQKYSCPGRPLDLGSIKRYGRQVLEALAFLQDKGFVMGEMSDWQRFLIAGVFSAIYPSGSVF